MGSREAVGVPHAAVPGGPAAFLNGCAKEPAKPVLGEAGAAAHGVQTPLPGNGTC